MKLKFIKKTGRFIYRNAPRFMAVAGVIGVWGTAFLVHRAETQVTEKDVEWVKNKVKDNPEVVISDEEYSETHAEHMKESWKGYTVAAVSGLATSALILTGDHISAKRIAGLSMALAAAKRRYQQSREVIEQRYGKEALKDFDKDMAKISANNNAWTNVGSTYFYDPVSDETFALTEEEMKSALIAINADFLCDGEAMYNDFRVYTKRKREYQYCNYGWTCENGLHNDTMMRNITYRKVKSVNKGDLINLYTIDYGKYAFPDDYWYYNQNSIEYGLEKWREEFIKVEGIDPLYIDINKGIHPLEDEKLAEKIGIADEIVNGYRDYGIEPDLYCNVKENPGMAYIAS